jgi:hypothetical protein
VVCIAPNKNKSTNNKNWSLSKLLIICYSAFCIVTILFLCIVRPCTIKQAKAIIAKEGYRNIFFVTHIVNSNNIEVYTKGEVLNKNKKRTLGYCFFQADKEGKNHIIFISVLDKNIFYEELGEYNKTILDIFKNQL